MEYFTNLFSLLSFLEEESVDKLLSLPQQPKTPFKRKYIWFDFVEITRGLIGLKCQSSIRPSIYFSFARIHSYLKKLKLITEDTKCSFLSDCV